MKKIYFFLMAMVISVTHAQDGALDLNYVPQNPFSTVYAIAYESGGSVLVAGHNNSTNTLPNMVRILPNGQVDPNFDVPFFDNFPNYINQVCYISTIYVQSDGRIIVGGYFNDNGSIEEAVIRLYSNGSLDTTFNCNIPAGFSAEDIVLQPVTNKLLVGGNSDAPYPTYTGQALYRLNSNGTVDSTFNSGGTGFTDTVYYNAVTVTTISTFSNGDIIVGGLFNAYNGTPVSSVAKINANGSLNTSFSVSGLSSCCIYDTAIQSDGKVLIGGAFTHTPSMRENLIRVTSTGTLDTSFSTITQTTSIKRLIIQPTGKIIVTGTFAWINGINRYSITRLNTNGTIDSCFDSGIGTTTGSGLNGSSVWSAVMAPDQSIYFGYYFNEYNGVPRPSFAKIIGQTTITAVADFGTVTDAGGVAIANVLSNDNLNGSVPTINDVVLTQVSTTNSNVNLNTSNGQIYIAPGTPPGSYTVNYKICQANCYCSTVAANITVTTPPIVPGLRADSRVTESGLQSNSKIIITGSFYNYNNIPVNRIARLKTDLTLDTSFLSTGAVPSTSPEASDIEIQADDKIIVTGNFVGYNGVNTGDNIVRLNPNGTIDAGFNPSGTGAAGSTNSGSIESVAIQSDGKIVIGGNFTSFNGIPLNYIARLNTNGTPDNSFVVGSGFDRPVTEVAIQTRSIIVTGQFVTYKGVPVRNIERLDSSGNLDTSFNPGGSGIGYLISGGIIYGQVEGIYPQTDGKIYLVGQFISYNGASRNNIVRLNANGTLDTSFNPGTGFNSTTRTLVVEPSGKIIVGGDFSTFNGVPVNSLVRLNTNGTLDNSFNTGTGPSGRVHTLKRQVDSKVIVGGEFINYNGIYAGNITRINPAIPGNQSRGPGVWESEPAIDITASVNNDITIYPNPSTGIFNLNFKGDANEKFEIVIYNTLGQLIHQGTVSPETAKQIDLSRFEAGNYYIRLQNEQRTINKVVTKK